MKLVLYLKIILSLCPWANRPYSYSRTGLGRVFFSRESEAHAGEIKKTQLEKYGESRASHLSLQCLTVKSWLNIIAVPMGAPTALKNKKTI